MGLLGGLGAAMAQHEAERLRAKQAQQMADMQNMAEQWLGQYSIGLATSTGTSNATHANLTYPNYEAKLFRCTTPTPAKPKPGTYRRGKVTEGSRLYSDSPLAWLDERVDEMRYVL